MMYHNHHRNIGRVRRLITLGIVGFTVITFITIALGCMLHHEISTTYMDNYQLLAQVGYTDLITAPQVVSDRLLLIITILPMIGIALIFPLLLLAYKDINAIILSCDFVDEDVARDVKISKTG